MVDLNALIREAAAIAKPRWQPSCGAGPVRVRMRLSDPAEIEACPADLRAMLVELFVRSVGPVWDGGELSIRTQRDAAYQTVVVTGRSRSGSTSHSAFRALFSIERDDVAEPTHPILREVIHCHGGVLAFETDAEASPILTMRFPLRAEKRPAKPTPDPDSPPKLRILMADDDRAVLDLNSQILERDGYEVVLAADGVEALERLASERIDLVLTDDVMPNMSGTQLASASRGLDPARPVVMLTGYSSRLAADGKMPDEVDILVAKPVTPRELREAVAQAFRKTGAEKAAA